MKIPGLGWFLGMSIRWKLQSGFFVVVMATILFNRWVGYGELQAVIDLAVQHQVDAVIINQLNQRLDQYILDSFWQSGIELAILFVLIGVLANFLVKPLLELCEALEGVDKGDLTVKVPNRARDEVGVLERNFNSMLGHLVEVMRRIEDSGKQMEQSAYQVTAISHEIAESGRAEQQRCDQVAAATSDLEQTSGTVMRYSESALERVIESEQRAQEGFSVVRNSIAKMDDTVGQVGRAANEVNDLTESAEQIFNIIATIRTIAEQTNLLALNAAIEAARAGEQGRGFAVVADEVRSLANRTTGATEEISEIITSLKGRVDTVSNTMNGVVDGVHASQDSARETSNVIEYLVGVVSETAASNRQILEASRDQLEKFSSLQSGLNQLFVALNENSTKVGTTATIGEDIQEVSGRLNELLAEFEFKRDREIEKNPYEKRQVPRLQHSLRVRIETDGGEIESVSSDFSMTGMKLRCKEPVFHEGRLAIHVYMPNEDKRLYELQTPLVINVCVCWERQQAQDYLLGVEFETLSPQQLDKMQACFDYFEKSPYFLQ